MKVSVCITVLNEGENIERLLFSLLHQTKKPSEIIVVDGGSKDDTLKRVKKYKSRIKFISAKGASIAKGRNIAVAKSKNPIVAITDAGCVVKEDWLEKITRPFTDKKVDVVAGFYHMTGNSPFQKAAMNYLGITPTRFDSKKFLPSARSMAFRRKVWEAVGGFNERLDRAGEDTNFNFKVIDQGFSMKRVKNAIVYWEVPKSLLDAVNKFYFYARGDAQAGVLIHKSKGFRSHNIKVLLIFARYIIGLSLFGLYFIKPVFILLPFILLFIYLLWALIKTGFWGVILQISSDIAVMAGFISGIISRNEPRRNSKRA